MSNSASNPKSIINPSMLLTDNEQQLLQAALSSNTTPSQHRSSQDPTLSRPGVRQGQISTNSRQGTGAMGSTGIEAYTSPDQSTPILGQDDQLGEDTSPLLDFDLEDGNFDWDNTGMIGDLPELSNGDNTEHHDKRKKSIDDDDGDEGNGKRREGEDKGSARKPGRKPLTGEPTTKRKAQNRAAQRAFRERKERHLKDLEAKVDDLEKASEATNHENGRLRAQVERLNTEVKEYRRRLSLNAPGVGRSPPRSGSMPYNNYTANNSNDFQFAFPKFGDLPNSIFGSNGSLAKVPSLANRSNPSLDRTSSASVPSLVRGSSSQSPITKSPVSMEGNYPAASNSPNLYRSPSSGLNPGSLDELNGLFSPSILASASRNASGDYGFTNSVSQPLVPASTVPRQASSSDSHSAMVSTSRFNSNATASPSASSMSHAGPSSSCGTTPEPSAESPGYRKQSEGALNTINEESAAGSAPGKTKFCSDWAKACGNIANPVPQAMQESNDPSAPSSVMKTPELNTTGIDWLAQQNGGQFDPELFGDYRDPQDNIMNNGYNDFFSDAFLTQDFNTPFNVGEFPSDSPQLFSAGTPAPAKPDLLTQCDAAQDANDEPEVVPADRPSYVTCDKLWDRVQTSEKVHSGEVDMDDLCSQLKAKAKCSGHGAVIAQEDIDRILGPEKQKDPKAVMSQFL